MLSNCKIFVAKSAGFCFGVDRAVKIVYNKLYNRKNVVTLGPIIHNTNVVDDLKSKGVYPVELDEVKQGQSVVIRSHGVPKNVYDILEGIGADVVDATCPFVARIHKIAGEMSADGYTILIAGDKSHPEVIGIRGFCSGESYVFATCEEFENLVKNTDFSSKKVAILAQTTYNKNMWEKCLVLFNRYIPHAEIFETICNATRERQSEAALLAQKSDLMIIVGGRHSSNTHKLKAVCEEYCPTLLVENGQGLNACNVNELIDLHKAKIIGISAGASTPAYIIKEVQQAMSEMLNNNVDEEFNLEAIDKTMKKIGKGTKIAGIVTDVKSNEIVVDIGTKHTGYVKLEELTDDPTKTPADIVNVGDTIDLIVLQTSDNDGIVYLSKKRVDAAAGFQKILEAKESDAVLEGTVTDIVRSKADNHFAGVRVACNGTRVFIPSSQTGLRRGQDENELLKTNVKFKLIKVDEVKHDVVGSIKVANVEERTAAQTAFFESHQKGDKIEGVVKSITDYGVFVDLGGVDGLVRRMDLSWNRIKHPTDVVSIGDTIEVTIKDIDPETKKVSLIYKKDEENPWEIFKANYTVGQTVKAKVVSTTSFGAFAQIIEGVDGLIHISQIANKRVNKVEDILAVGDEVECQITDIDYDKKRISLSRRALLPDDNGNEEE